MEDRLPIIGIFGWKTGDNSYGCTISYMQYLSSFGIVKIITPEESIDEELDLVLVPGGADVDPRRYGAIPHWYTGKPDPMKEYFDTVVLPKYIKIGTPVFGICRGIQAISVLFGAKLIQHMVHETNTEENGRGAMVHPIELCDTSFKKDYMKAKNGSVASIKVNSMHHQCVSALDFPACLEILAFYKGRNPSIEIIRHRTLPIYAVQYHPEELDYDPLGDFIVHSLIAKSKHFKNDA